MSEWYELKILLRSKQLNSASLGNQFYTKLLKVLDDKNGNFGDKLSGYRDALCAAPSEISNASLPLVDHDFYSEKQLSMWGLKLSTGTKEVSLSEDDFWDFSISDGELDTQDVYKLSHRRSIKDFPMDPSLMTALGVERYKVYKGAGQKDAVRLVLSNKGGGTFLVNLPTGVGKTFIIEALSAFSVEREFTLVVVPTVGLAIDLAKRMEDFMRERGLDHGGSYCWHAGVSLDERREIISRIYSGKQKILISSPESALTSLQHTIVNAARSGLLNSIVIDEAHIVDHWGAEFRPHFQGIAAVLKSARGSAGEVGKKIRCVFLSATYSKKTIGVLKRLFLQEDEPLVEVHSSFLRPEIQYAVRETSAYEHPFTVSLAIRRLPKPLIVYVTRVVDAELYFNMSKHDLGIDRVALFTGNTGSVERQTILERWRYDELDIVVATSAFGVGINKPNVRSVLHASVPENIDRFYQEVGRSGRDGVTSQSLIVYHKDQFRIAKNLNTQSLITLEKGYERWGQLWSQGSGIEDGKRLINMGVIPNRLSWQGDENLKWNWRTLMLMQRAGLVEVEVFPYRSQNDQTNTDVEEDDHSKQISDDNASVLLKLNMLEDELQTGDVWKEFIGPRRKLEYKQQAQGYFVLKDWLGDPNNTSLCGALASFYTINGIGPERVCAGCPSCRRQGEYQSITGTIGAVSHVAGFGASSHWPNHGYPDRTRVSAYYENSDSTLGPRFVDDLIDWISFMIENRIIQAVRSTDAVLQRLNSRLARGLRKFWIAMSIDESLVDESLWRELIIVPPGANMLPRYGLSDNPRILIAPKNIPNNKHPSRLWWEGDATVIPLETMIRRMSSVAYK